AEAMRSDPRVLHERGKANDGMRADAHAAEVVDPVRDGVFREMVHYCQNVCTLPVSGGEKEPAVACLVKALQVARTERLPAAGLIIRGAGVIEHIDSVVIRRRLFE